MRQFRHSIILAFLIFSCCMAFQRGNAQVSLSAEEIERYKKEARQLVSFLQFTFNTIGDPQVPVREKDIIINQSFSKFFKDEEVQIEDDLDENRDVPVNKDVQAYLKDIDFFYKKAVFTFGIEEIEHQVNEKNQLFFKITLNRNLKGVTIEGDTVDNNRTRYIEVNLNDAEKDLKIASIYTTKLNEKEELRKWWNELPLSWKEIFGEHIILHDTIRMDDVLWFSDSLAKFNFLIAWKMSRDTLTYMSRDTMYLTLTDSSRITAAMLDRQLQKITARDTLDISGMSEILSLEPLSKLSKLRRIDCSHTFVPSLMPLRNLTQLEYLNCGFTPVDQLQALRYSTKLEELIIDGSGIDEIGPAMNFIELKKLSLNQTSVDSLDPVSGLNKLKELELVATNVSSLKPLKNLNQLERLDFSDTQVDDLKPIEDLRNIYFLKFEYTAVKNLQPLNELMNLHFLFMNGTPVSDLSPLNGLPELNKVYCDQSGVTRSEAFRFMEENPQVLVIYESADLVNWWEGLSNAWKEIFGDKVKYLHNPTKEELHEITRIRELNIADNRMISSLEPLASLPMLRELNCQGTSLRNISPLASLTDIRLLNMSDNRIADLDPLRNLLKLEILYIDNTDVADIGPIMSHEELQNVYCDNTPVPEDQIIEFMITHPDCLVVYQTDELRAWWEGLPDVWKLLAETVSGSAGELSREQLQEIVNLRSLNLDEVPGMAGRALEIQSLEHLRKMIFLEKLQFTNTRISHLDPLRGHQYLHTLVCPNNPIVSLEPLSEVKNLRMLDVQNTPVEDLEFLATLDHLQKLNCSGTQIKNLKGLEYLQSLELLECYNTDIRKLKRLVELENLKLVRCYNTRISDRRVEKFRDERPDVEVIHY